MFKRKNSIFAILALLGWSAGLSAAEPRIRVGYFPNVTHAQALIGLANGKFRGRLGGVAIETKVFNAGPSAVEALFADAIDLAYIGPGPAINAYARSGGLFKIIAGAAQGGAALVVREGAGIQSAQDFSGKKIATPQLGNTQDLAARAWLKRNGLRAREKGGTVQILPLANSDQLTLFVKKELDAAWAVEPWVSRLVTDGGGKVFLDESEVWKPLTGGAYATAVILVSDKFLKENPDLVEKWLAAHCELTDWINAHPGEAAGIVNAEIKKLTGKTLPEKVLAGSLRRVRFSVDPAKKSILQQGQWAFEEGFLGKRRPDLSGLCDLTLLNGVLKGTKKSPIPD